MVAASTKQKKSPLEIGNRAFAAGSCWFLLVPAGSCWFLVLAGYRCWLMFSAGWVLVVGPGVLAVLAFC